jgi:hypothetical protein
MKQHRADGVSLVFGLIFLVIAAWWTVGWFVDINIDIPNLGWLAALGLIAIGLVGVVASLRGGDPADASTTTEAPVPPVAAVAPTSPAEPVTAEMPTAPTPYPSDLDDPTDRHPATPPTTKD